MGGRAAPEADGGSPDAGPSSANAPVGVRAAVAGESGASSSLRWVRSGAFVLAAGDLVAVRGTGGEGDECAEWFGTVVIPADRLLEWPPPEVVARWPVVVRRATAAEMPTRPTTDGRRLLDSLGLPPEVLQRPT